MRVLAIILLLLGLMFFIASADGRFVSRMITGGVMCGIGIFLLVHSNRRRSGRGGEGGLVQKLDISGDVKLQEMKCTKCGGSLTSRDAVVKAGAVFITCPYCRSEYQIEEAPKW
jgi:ribosomal protein S27AE